MLSGLQSGPNTHVEGQAQTKDLEKRFNVTNPSEFTPLVSLFVLC